MNTEQAYNLWSAQYDSNENKTRDLEGEALKVTLAGYAFRSVLEIGCGTGKNTGTLLDLAEQVRAVDLSEEMLRIAREKISSSRAEFLRGDLTGAWDFAGEQYELITFSLVLEHIEDLGPVFKKAAGALAAGGMVYAGELHPFKQYHGSKARFDTPKGVQVVPCFTHHVSDFTQAAEESGLEILTLKEFFDADDRSSPPRILSLLFRKPASL